MRDVEEELTPMPRLESDEPWTRDVLVLWPKGNHIKRANKREAERRPKGDHVMRVNNRDMERRLKGDHMMRVNKSRPCIKETSVKDWKVTPIILRMRRTREDSIPCFSTERRA